MKKFIVAGVMALGILSASAQTKIGYIDTDSLIGYMPEAAQADAELKAFQDALSMQQEDLAKEFQTKLDAYNKDSATLTPSMKEVKKTELASLYGRLNNWNQEAQDKYNQKASEKIAPIRTKAMDAIKTVAREKGYGYVLDASASGILVSPPGDNLLQAVKAKLGIKDSPVAPAAVPGTNKPKNN
ncbi:MAG: OmpH family outer membrane protein [Ferruginibacter sp.]